MDISNEEKDRIARADLEKLEYDIRAEAETAVEDFDAMGDEGAAFKKLRQLLRPLVNSTRPCVRQIAFHDRSLRTTCETRGGHRHTSVTSSFFNT